MFKIALLKMKTLLTIISFITMGIASNAQAHEFLPENDLWIGTEYKSNNGVDQQGFDRVLSALESIYQPIVAKYGGRLVVVRKWSDGTVNAQAYKQGSNWYIEMFGGLARHPAMNLDGFALVACHELGHHLGGAPSYSSDPSMSVEGQSDYYSTAKCLRKLFRGQNNQVGNEDPLARQACAQIWTDPSEQDICVRTVMSGKASANLSHSLSGGGGAQPAINTPDPRVVSRTSEGHPDYQCRLDTYFRGALCDLHEDDPAACSSQNNKAVAARPLCWFKPSNAPAPNPTPNPTPNPGPTPRPNPSPAPIPSPDPGGIARAPLLNGQAQLHLRNPNQAVLVRFDARQIAGAGGVYMEVSAPNQPFPNPNDVKPAPGSSYGATFRAPMGTLVILPSRHLPGWGQYSIRIIPLDRQLRRSVGRFSDSAVLTLSP